MIIHPPAYNIALRPYYQWMTTGKQINRADNMAAAYLLDYVENADPIAPTETWKALPFRQLYDAMSPFVAQSPVRNALEWLEADGLIETRHDPSNKLNRTKQYRLNETEVQRRIDCWSISEGLKNAQPRIIQAVTREQAQTTQIMHNDGVEDMDKVHTRDSVLISHTPIQQDIKEDNHYESTMALLHVLLGVEVFPVVGKKPAPKTPDDPFGWEWSKKRLNAPGRQMATMHAWKVATGYGMLPVKGSNLVFIDIDRADFERKLMELLPRLATTYRQQRADHACLAVRLPFTLDSRYQIEDEQGEIASIRNHNSYQVGAGSVHPSGESYVATNMVEPIDLTQSETDTLLDLFTGSSKKVQPAKPMIAITQRVDPIVADQNLKRWARKGQEQALRQLSSASHGAFNTTLYKTACRLSNLAKVTGETESQLHDLLWEVCEQAGYVRRDGSSQTWATIRSGIRAGEQLELNLPEQNKRGKAS